MTGRSLTEPLRAAIAAGRFVRTVNFHATPHGRAAELDDLLRNVARRFQAVTPVDLDTAFTNQAWRFDRPPVVLAFFNGYRDNYDVARPLLDRYGLVGWFFVVTGWAGMEPQRQAAWAGERGIRVPVGEARGDACPRVAMSWDEIRGLSHRHVVASHTRTHARVDAGRPEALREEIVGSQRDLRREIGHGAAAFAWLQGAAYGSSAVADDLVLRAGYRYLVGNATLQRLPERRALDDWPDGRPKREPEGDSAGSA